MRTLFLILWVSLTTLLSGCADEPDRLVQATTADGAFSLSLEAARDWMRPGSSLPILVRLESRSGPVTEEFLGEIELVANRGSVSPSYLSVILSGPEEDGTGAQSQYAQWITFTASSYISDPSQAEIYALFGDTRATLKVRITPVED